MSRAADEAAAAPPCTAPPCDFQMGDHVYQWCSLAGIPAVYQHHGIVMDVYYSENSNSTKNNGQDEAEEGQWMLTIADFSNWNDDDDDDDENNELPRDDGTLTSSALSVRRNHRPRPQRPKSLFGKSGRSSKNGGHPPHSGGCLRTYDCPASEWTKCVYEAGWWQRHWHRSGTCTAVSSDAPGLVRARVQFLIDHGEARLPAYHAVRSNCECVAVWCKTGTWATLQASSLIALTVAGQMKSAVTVAGAVAGAQVTVPAAGAWGWLGYTTHVSLASTQPYLLPAIAAYGVVTAGGPALWLARVRQQWKELTVQLNTAFWEHAVAHPDVFVECITHWSTQYEPEQMETVELTSVCTSSRRK